MKKHFGETLYERARMRRLREAVENLYPPAPGTKLENFKAESAHSTMWRCKTVLEGVDKTLELCIKVNRLGEDPIRFRAEREEARKIAKLHSHCSPHHLGIFTVLATEDVGAPISSSHISLEQDVEARIDKDIEYLKNKIVRNYELGPDTIIIEVTEMIHGKTLNKILNKYGNDDELTPGLKQILKNVCETFHKIHFSPEDSQLGILNGTFEQKLRKRTDIYNSSLEQIQQRIAQYLPLDIPHPFLSDNHIYDLINYGRQVREEWWNDTERLRWAHGDAQGRNVMVKDSNKQIYIFDWGRLVLADYTADWGRFFTDFLWTYEMSGRQNKFILKVMNYMIEQCELLYQDPRFRQGLCMGLIALMSIRLCHKYQKDIDPLLALAFFEKGLAMLSNMKFEVNDAA